MHYYYGVLPFVYTKIGQNSKSGVLQCTYTYTVAPHLALAGYKTWTKGEQTRNKRTKGKQNLCKNPSSSKFKLQSIVFIAQIYRWVVCIPVEYEKKSENFTESKNFGMDAQNRKANHLSKSPQKIPKFYTPPHCAACRIPTPNIT